MSTDRHYYTSISKESRRAVECMVYFKKAQFRAARMTFRDDDKQGVHLKELTCQKPEQTKKHTYMWKHWASQQTSHVWTFH